MLTSKLNFAAAHRILAGLNVGDKVKACVIPAWQSRFGTEITFIIADKNHTGYPAGSVTLIADKIIQLLCLDAREPANPNADRVNFGNNRHIHTNLLSWMNSSAAAGGWYSAKHIYDTPPTNTNVYECYNEYDALAGFLSMLPAQFVSALMETTLTAVKNTVTDGGGSETFTARVFLPSTTEVGLANENGIAEGVKLALFSNNTSRLAYPTTQAVNCSEYKDPCLNTASTRHWWLRTPYAPNTRNARIVHIDGTLNYNAVCDGRIGVRPLCNLPSTLPISREADATGAYSLIL